MFASKEIATERYAICRACDKFTAIKTCSECGCLMLAKVKFATSSCPLNKWSASTDAKNIPLTDTDIE